MSAIKIKLNNNGLKLLDKFLFCFFLLLCLMINSTTFFHFHKKMFVLTFEINSRCTSSFHQILLHRLLYLNFDPLSYPHHLPTTVCLFYHTFQKTLSNLLGNNALMILYIQVFFSPSFSILNLLVPYPNYYS